jgi:hypothetical protein
MRSISSRRLAPALELVAGMAQVVKMDHGQPGRAESWPPGAADEVAASQRSAFGAGEHEPVVAGSGVR